MGSRQGKCSDGGGGGGGQRDDVKGNEQVGVWCPWLCSSCRTHRPGKWFAGEGPVSETCFWLCPGRVFLELAGGRDMFQLPGATLPPQHLGPLF